jgi:hypothetical protein
VEAMDRVICRRFHTNHSREWLCESPGLLALLNSVQIVGDSSRVNHSGFRLYADEVVDGG